MAKPLKTLVIGTSLTPASDAVVRAGAALARATGAVPWLVHAYLPMTFPSDVALDARWIDEEVKSLRESLAEQARRTGLSELPGFTPDQIRLVVGSPHREILDLARRVEAGLVVVGAAESHLGFLGSNADRVIRKAVCPVFVVRSEAALPPCRVEIPVDLSPISAHAMVRGLELLKQIGAPLGEIEALFVLNPFEVGGSIHFTRDQVERFAKEELHRFLEDNAPESGSPRLSRVRTGYAREEILAALGERRADLVVLGTHGRSGFERLVIGSVTQGVLRSAPCNLLIVPPEPGFQQEAEPGQTRKGADWTYVSDEMPAVAGRS